jgi:bacterioferritin (cytochrome b1)
VTRSRSALLGASTALAAFGPRALSDIAAAAAAADPADIPILNEALALELAAVSAYAYALGTGLLDPSVTAVAQSFRTDHQAHAEALGVAVKAAGGTPVRKPAALAYPTLRTQIDILKFAETLERQAASTYLSVIPTLADRTLARAAAAILGVETTHVAALSAALGEGKPYGAFVS